MSIAAITMGDVFVKKPGRRPYSTSSLISGHILILKIS